MRRAAIYIWKVRTYANMKPTSYMDDSGTKHLDRLYERKLAAIEALKQLLLHRASVGTYEQRRSR